MQSKPFLASVLFAAALPNFVFAATAEPSKETADAIVRPQDSEQPPAQTAPDELARLQSQIPVLQAKVALAKLKRELEDATTKNQPSTGTGLPPLPGPVFPSNQAAAQSTPQASAPLVAPGRSNMRVVAISAFDGRYAAVLDIDGQATSVRQNDALDGGWVVASITDSTVTLERGKQRLVLRV